MKSKFVMLIGLALMAEGFLTNIYSSLILFPPTSPPMMKPIEEMDYVLVMYKQAFLISGVIGILITIAGIFFGEKENKLRSENFCATNNFKINSCNFCFKLVIQSNFCNFCF